MEQEDSALFTAHHRRLIATLHNKKEETILYPIINQSLSAQERNELLEKMQ